MDILIYSSPKCPPCTQLKKYLKGKRLSYEEVNANKEPHTTALAKLTSGVRILPTTVIGKKHIVQGLNYRNINLALSAYQKYEEEAETLDG